MSERNTAAALGTGPLELTVAGASDLTPRIRRFELRAAAGGQLPAWTPGAHLDMPVHLATGLATRSYSLIGDCAQRDHYEIAVLRDDAGKGGSLAMHRDYASGRVVRCGLPANQFELHTDERPCILIAGGIGITPIRSMAIELQRRGAEFALHYAARSVTETALMDDLCDRFGAKISFWHSDGAPTNQLNIQKVMAGLPGDGAVYVCGPLGLIQAAIDVSARLDLPSTCVRFERFSSATPQAADHAFDVVLRVSSRVVHVRANQTILDAVLAAGIPAAFGCRAGQCGTCAVDVLAGEVDHRDTVLDDADRNLFDRMCICVSRAKFERLEIDL